MEKIMRIVTIYLVLLSIPVAGFTEDNIQSAKYADEYQRQVEIYNEQTKKAEEQQAESERQLIKSAELQKVTEKQLKQAEEQAERMEHLLEIWELQAKRYDAILNKWEAQVGIGGSK